MLVWGKIEQNRTSKYKNVFIIHVYQIFTNNRLRSLFLKHTGLKKNRDKEQKLRSINVYVICYHLLYLRRFFCRRAGYNNLESSFHKETTLPDIYKKVLGRKKRHNDK